MSHLPIYMRIRSEYFEHDASRYRLAITKNTLIQSLRHQTDKNFGIVLSQSPMDPFFSSRQTAFNLSIKPPARKEAKVVEETNGSLPEACESLPEAWKKWISTPRFTTESEYIESDNSKEPRIEIEVGDDDYLSPHFVENVRKVPEQQKNSFLICRNGYVFFEGSLKVWRDRESFVETTMIVDPSNLHVDNNIVCTDDASWIYCRHKMNSIKIPEVLFNGNPVQGLNWPGWKQNVVAAYCQTTIKLATANGCTLEPMKSKSVRIAKGSGRTRRFGK